MTASPIHLESIPDPFDSYLVSASSISISLPGPARKFFRHGWQSSTLTTWIDPTQPYLPVRAPEFRLKDEDPAYALHENPMSIWVGAVELEENDILLLAALDLSGRIELDRYSLTSFYEDEHAGEWFIARGEEEEVFAKYANLLEIRFGQTRVDSPPRVWCSWYSLLKWINEPVLSKVLHGLGDLPFDVFQIDDGWQDKSGYWEAGKNFPSGMAAFAKAINDSGRTAGIWLAPFIVSPKEDLYHEHPEWLLRDEHGNPVNTGIHWTDTTYALDTTHPEVLAWLEILTQKVVSWGYNYLKLDFLHAGAAVGKRYKDMPREAAYREALQVIRNAAADAYILTCNAPILPSLGLCDGMRIGPDVSPFWLNRALTVWLNNPNDNSTQNAIRTSLHRLWLKPLVNTDPDVSYFNSKYTVLKPREKQLLQDLGTITGFKATSDLPQWLNAQERKSLRRFLENTPAIQKMDRYTFRIDDREVDFTPAIPIEFSDKKFPIWLARYIGKLTVAWHQALPAIWESLKPGSPE